MKQCKQCKEYIPARVPPDKNFCSIECETFYKGENGGGDEMVDTLKEMF